MSERYIEEACLKLISPLHNVFWFFFSRVSSKASRNVISLALLAGIKFPQASCLRCPSFQLSCRYDFFHLSPAALFHLIVIRKKESFLTGLTLGGQSTVFKLYNCLFRIPLNPAIQNLTGNEKQLKQIAAIQCMQITILVFLPEGVS